MPRMLLLIGTRKGLFLLESDRDRRDWKLRGPYCESWPVYHAIHDGASGTIYAAAASDWHGSAVWRSSDLGETWALSSEGLAYDEAGSRKVSKVSTLAVTDGRVLVGAEAPGLFESRDGGESWSLLTTLAGQPGSELWDDPASQPPGNLGISAILPDSGDPSHFWTIVQGVGIFETETAARRGRLATRGSGPTGRGRTTRSASASTGSSARLPTPAGCSSRTTWASTEATTAAIRGSRSPTGCRASSASPRRLTRTTGTPST